MSNYSEITVAQAQDIIASQGPLLLDARDSHSYKEGHIDGAMMAHDGLMERLVKQRQFDRPIIIYCYHGNSSKDMADFFGNLGFKSVYSLAGGYVEWKKASA